MNARPRLRPAVGLAASLLVLTACGLEKPAPIVTVVSGGESVYTEAATWCFEGQTPPDCAERAEGVTELSVRGGETVGVDVGKQLVDNGWIVELTDPEAEQPAEPDRSEPQTGHYFTFEAPNLRSGASLLLTVRSLDEEAEPNGEWRFRLTPRT